MSKAPCGCYLNDSGSGHFTACMEGEVVSEIRIEQEVETSAGTGTPVVFDTSLNEILSPPTYKATHRSVHDGSEAMSLGMTAGGLHLMNEDGYTWVSGPNQWEEIG